ncbi:MAG: GYF domain-containing protein [Thermoguttaceae bacterium]
MGIRFYCPNGHKLNVKEFQAGRRGICPFCGVKMQIPLASTRPSSSSKDAATPASDSPIDEPQDQGSGGSVLEFDFLDDVSQAASVQDQSPHPIPLPKGEGTEGRPHPSPLPKGEGTEGRPHPSHLPKSEGTEGRPHLSPLPKNEETPDSAVLAASRESTPAAAWSEPADAPPPVKPTDVLTEAGDVVWYIRPASGGQFGPANADVMRSWIAEGRVGPDSLVWCEGWRDWREASDVFPQLSATEAFPGLETIVPEAITTPLFPHTARHHKQPRRVPLLLIGWLAVAFVALVAILLLILFRQSQ